MANYAVIDETGLVVNTIVLEEGSLWEPPEGHTIIQSDVASIGWTYAAENFVRPPEPTLPPPTILEQIYALEVRITQRRLREAILSSAGAAWLAEVDGQIALLRTQLRG